VDDQRLRRLAPDRYSDFSLVGKGGMGVVYLALDSELNRRVAFKMVLPDPTADRDAPAPRTPLEATPPDHSQQDSSRSFDELRKRFLQEAWVTGAMQHPGVVPVYELGETEEGIPYYTMRYVTGERTLKAAIEALSSFDERLALLEPFLKICDTIRYAHARGIIHRDLKPENIALGSFGEVIVLDWGLAKTEGKPDISGNDWQARIEAYRDATDFKTVAGALGTPGFMAPEAALGRSEEVDARSDVYSLGAILHLILTGSLPFKFENFLEYVNLVIREDAPRADEVDDAIPSELADVCARALQREADERFGSVDELAAAVRRWQTEGPIDREIRVLIERAHHELESGKHLTGNLLLLHLDRATAAVNRVLHLRPGQADAQQLLQRLKTLREHGIHARVRTERLVVLQRVAAALLTIGAVVALIVFGLLSDEREKTANLQQASRDKLIKAELKAAQSRRRAEIHRGALARSLAALSQAARADHDGGGARILAAAALIRDQDELAWRALADAELTWSPTLRWILHGVEATAVTFDPDNPMRLLIGDDEGRVHDIDLGQEPPAIMTYDALDAAIRCVACVGAVYEPRVAAGSADGQVAILAPDKAGPIRTMPAQLTPVPAKVEFEDDALYRGTPVTAIHRGPNGGLLVGYEDGRLRLFDGKGRLLHVARHHAAAITALSQTPGTPTFYSASRDGSINRWDVDSLTLADVWSSEPPHPIEGFRIDRYAETLEGWSPAGAVRTWSAATGKPGTSEPSRVRGGAHAVLTRGGQLLVVAGPNGRLIAYNRNASDPIHAGRRNESNIRVLAASPDGALIAVARDDRTVRIWDLSMRSDATPHIAAADPERRRVIAVRSDGQIDVLTEGATEPHEFRDDGAKRVTATAISPEGDRLLTVDLGGQIVIWNIDEKRRIRTVRDDRAGHLTAIAWAEGEGRFLTGNLKGDVVVWHWPTGRFVTFDEATRRPIALIARATATNRVAAADTAGGIYLWDSHERTVQRSWTGSGPLLALALSPNAKRIAAIRADAMLVVWDGKQWQERGKLPERTAILAFSVDEQGHARWVDAAGRIGADTTVQDFPALPTRQAGGAWILVEPGERMAQYSSAFGLVLDRIRFGLRPIPTKRFKGAIRVGARGGSLRGR